MDKIFELREIVRLHSVWLSDDPNGKRADLSGADLRYADLRNADLSGADLSGADLRNADLSGADLSGADLRDADLSGANLRNADLSGADLSGADLRDATGNGREVQTVQTDRYTVVIADHIVCIGCQSHTWQDWMTFDDTRIARMDEGALTWWNAWKPILSAIIKQRKGN